MYSETLEPKIEVMFENLRKKVSSVVIESLTSNEAITDATKLVSSELTTRSRSILSDMLFDLSRKLLDTDFFATPARKNKFYEINLRQEILNKFQFTPSITINYQEESRTVQALKIGGATLTVGGVAELGYALISSLSLSSAKVAFSRLVPIPVCVLVVCSLGAALVDYFVIAPKKNKKTLDQALDRYLNATKEQFVNWFDEVEKYFNMRIEEIKQTL